MDTSCSSSSSLENIIIEALIKRGWCFGDIDKVKALIVIQSALHGEGSPTVDLIESELCNMDLKSIGAKSLPDSSVLRSKLARLQGPKVLQISAARDISRSIIAESSGNSSNNKRLLRLKLTDGHSEITSIEYSHIPSIPDDVVPGTKVRFEDKAVIRNGILCLDPKVITVIGGVVESLYEEWQMNRKYSGFSRTSVQLSDDGDTGGPPQFEKLHVGAPSSRFNQGKYHQFSGPSSKSSNLAFADKDGDSIYGKSSKLQHSGMKVDSMNSNVKLVSVGERNEGKISSSGSRPKEVVESIPVQNQAAAQKLLEKMNHNGRGDRFARGGRHRGKGKFEEAPVLTLDEWEKRKASASSSMKQGIPDVRQDEDLARQLQNQFDLEDHEQRGPQMTQADSIKLNMFSFPKDNVNDDGSTGFRGRGRGRGRGGGGGGRGRGRGGGRGRGRSG